MDPIELQAPVQVADKSYRLALASPCKAKLPHCSLEAQQLHLSTEGAEWVRSVTAQIVHTLAEKSGRWFVIPVSEKAIWGAITPLVAQEGAPVLPVTVPKGTEGSEGAALLECAGVTFANRKFAIEWVLHSVEPEIALIPFVPGETDADIKEVLIGDEGWSNVAAEEMDEVPVDTNANAVRIWRNSTNAEKLQAKDRVRRAKLQAFLARHRAEREEDRFYRNYDLSDNESTFTEYDGEGLETDEEGDEFDLPLLDTEEGEAK
jgi:hypothetical protein